MLRSAVRNNNNNNDLKIQLFQLLNVYNLKHGTEAHTAG